MRTTITVNGRQFDSIDQMPPDVRQQYDRAMSMLADRDGNGIPDIIEGKLNPADPSTGTTVVTKTTSRLVINRREVPVNQAATELQSLLEPNLSTHLSARPRPLFQYTIHFPLRWSSIFGIISVLSFVAFIAWLFIWQ